MSEAPFLVVAPTGPGGVAGMVDAVVPLLPEARRVSSGGGLRAPIRWLRAAALGGGAVAVHLHSSFRDRALPRDGALVAALSAGGRPFVLQFHGTSRGLVDAPPPGLVRALAWASRRGVLASVDPALVAALAAWGIEATRARIAVDPAWLPDPSARRPEPGLVLFLGRLVPEKGVRELLASVPGWPAGARLVVAGEGPLAPEVRRAGGQVMHVGWVSPAERRAWLSRAALVVLPSREEAAPLAVAEAVASGVPVVASGAGAVASLVGSAGLVLDRPDARALARAVASMLATTVPSEAGRVRAETSPAAVAEEWRALWRCAVSRSRSG